MEEKQAAFGIFIPSPDLQGALFTGAISFFFFFNTILVFIFVYFLAVPCSFLDFSSPNGNQTWGSAIPSSEIPRPNHWTTREFHEAISILSRRVWSSLGG